MIAYIVCIYIYVHQYSHQLTLPESALSRKGSRQSQIDLQLGLRPSKSSLRTWTEGPIVGVPKFES